MATDSVFLFWIFYLYFSDIGSFMVTLYAVYLSIFDASSWSIFFLIDAGWHLILIWKVCWALVLRLPCTIKSCLMYSWGICEIWCNVRIYELGCLLKPKCWDFGWKVLYVVGNWRQICTRQYLLDYIWWRCAGLFFFFVREELLRSLFTHRHRLGMKWHKVIGKACPCQPPW